MDGEDFTTTTLFYDGQFWVALTLRSLYGKLYEAKHIFGAEPTNPQFTRWMTDDYAHHQFRRVPQSPTIREKWATRHEEGIPRSSLELFKESQKAYLLTQKKEGKEKREMDKEDKYRRKQEKRKGKRNH